MRIGIIGDELFTAKGSYDEQTHKSDKGCVLEQSKNYVKLSTTIWFSLFCGTKRNINALNSNKVSEQPSPKGGGVTIYKSGQELFAPNNNKDLVVKMRKLT